MSNHKMKDTILLFDVDGTLTKPRNVIEPHMFKFLQSIRKQVPVALVGGSDLPKILEQMGGNHALSAFDYVFSENGLVAHQDGKLLAQGSIAEHMGEEKLQDLINFALGYMSKIRLPCKRGTFVEFRKGLINFSPIGRSCSQAERDQFHHYNKEHHVLEDMLKALQDKFSSYGLCFAIGGQISMDCYPVGWDKRYCLRFLKQFKTIHFYGDKTNKGGNDHEIFEDPATIGHTVTSPEDTEKQLRQLLPHVN